MHPPASIFTGNSAAPSESLQTDPRRLSTPEYREFLAHVSPVATTEAPKPPTPLDKPTSSVTTITTVSTVTTDSAATATPSTARHPSWTLHLPSPDESSIHRRRQVIDALKTPPAVAGKKRSARPAVTPSISTEALLHSPASEPLHKRRRLPTRHRHSLDHATFPKAAILRDTTQPPSPLFFSSNARRARPNLPARFSSSEAAARMLSKTRGEESAVKTVTLARGTYSGLSPPGPTSVPSGRNSERSSLPRTVSPDGRDRSDPLRLLGSISIVELLEHDTRPTFIVDIGDAANYTPGSVNLQIPFANNALRSDPVIWDLVAARTSEQVDDEVTARASAQFKGWLLTGDGVEDVNPSPIEHGGMVWSCYTLRKRLRVVSGALPSTNDFDIPSTSLVNQFSIPSVSSLPNSASITAARSPSSVDPAEPQDYFGNSVPTPMEQSSTEQTPATSVLQTEPVSITEGTTDAHGRTWPRPEKLDLSTFRGSSSFTNECVLRAQCAGDIDAFHRHPSPPPEHDVGFFDWTRLPVSSTMPRHIQFARSVDWASTPLGPIEFWSNDLRAMCNLIMASPHPAAMYWGDDLVAIYNEAYIGLAGQKHPQLMGQCYRIAWAEIWDSVKDVFANARQTGQATMKDDDCLFMKRNGFLEETYFSWSIIPMVGEDGSVMGLYNPAFEKTRRKIAERRMLTLREVGERTATARDVKSFWEQVLDALKENEHDTPFALLYSVSDDHDSDSSSLHSSSLLGTKQCFLEGTLGVPEHHLAAPEQIDLKEGQEGFGPVFREVMKTDKPVVLGIGSGDLPISMMTGLDWRGFGDACRDVVICPIHPTTGESILGFLVIGVNPRRPYDDDYNLFIQLLSRQLATSLASVVLFEEEIRRGQKAARLAAEDRFNLSEQLAARTQEARDSETRFTRMAEYSPAGLFIANHEGRITYCNDTWYEISRVPKEPQKTDSWIDYVKDEDKDLIRNHWKALVEDTAAINIEFRFKTPWADRSGNQGDTWVVFSAFPEKYEDGMLKGIFGSITNISPQKWAEGFQKRKMEEAVELKRQQENFIDITSHEMRNPLSAILQCADEICKTLNNFRSSGEEVIPDGLVADSIDAAQTIILCAQHQKRIVDDVLTLSKIDSAMLMVTPVDVEPLQVVQRALKMFEGEVQNAEIQMEFVVTDTFKTLDITWVKMDPSRVLQVLINLTTNAIKFTTTETSRTIKVILSASRERPSKTENPTVSFFPFRSKRVDQTLGPDWGDGEELFLEFAVQDTGRGLTEEEKTGLFQRFSQASPRTHVQYGGSGLGLFISRELTELQGGEIGMSSQSGKGSTFAFYVKCRRSSAPSEVTEPVHAIGRQPSNARERSRIEAPKIKDFASTPKGAAVGSSKVKQSHLKVLIVEDNLVNQKVLQRQLNNNGIKTYVANHGGEALDRLKESIYWRDSKPDALDIGVVLMDKEMPVMDGLQCTSRIREWEQSGLLKSHIPIIAVTANARSEQIATLLQAGMDDVVSKPFRIDELLPKIEELAAKHPSNTLDTFQVVVPSSSKVNAATVTQPPQ